MQNLIAVFLGGAIGASLRYLTGLLVVKTIGLVYIATFLVNIIGCFLIGAMYALTIKFTIPNSIKLFIMAGFLGGLTTFSSFCLENLIFLKEGKFIHFLAYTFLSLIIGVSATAIGYYIFSGK